MIDVIVPAFYGNAHNAVFNTMADLADSTDVPLRFIVSGQGGVAEDWNVVKNFLDMLRDPQDMHYGLLARDGSVTCENDAILQGTELIKHDLVLILTSRTRITDDGWFTKMMGPIQKAPNVGGVFLPEEYSGTNTLPPHEMGKERYASAGVLTTRAVLESNRGRLVRGHPDFFVQFQEVLEAGHSARWMHAGVNMEIRSAVHWP